MNDNLPQYAEELKAQCRKGMYLFIYKHSKKLIRIKYQSLLGMDKPTSDSLSTSDVTVTPNIP